MSPTTRGAVRSQQHFYADQVNQYFSGKLILFGAGILGVMFMMSAVIVYLMDLPKISMYILVAGIFCMCTMPIGIKILGHKLRHFVDDMQQILHNNSTLDSDRREATEEKPPSYEHILETEEQPPSYNDAVADEDRVIEGLST